MEEGKIITTQIELSDLLSREFEGFWERKTGYGTPESEFNLKFLWFEQTFSSPDIYHFIGCFSDDEGTSPINGRLGEYSLKFRRYQDNSFGVCKKYVDYEGEIERTNAGVYVVKGTWEVPHTATKGNGEFEMESKNG